jgi:multidrug efflux pump subunit AcrA (membrane-fusion protein)
MGISLRLLSCLALVFALAGGVLLAQAEVKKKSDPKADKRPAAAKAAAAKGATHKMEKGPFKVEVSLKGIFEAEDMNEIALRPEAWTPDVRGIMSVLKAVEHGAHVKKGDTLVELDLEKIDQMIRDQKTDSHLMELAIKQAEEELPVLDKVTPIDLALSEQAKKRADEDLQKFLAVDRPFAERQAHFYVKSANDWLDYAREELKQLEKMYRANDIREETEEIILRRQRNQVESALFFVHWAEIERDQVLKNTLPRQEQNLKDNTVRQDLGLFRAKATLPLALKQKHLALEKMKYERDKAVDKLQKLEADRATMTVKAPVEGIVYYGKCSRGQWNSAGAMATKLVKGGMLMPEEVFITIVRARPLFVRATVEEKELHLVRPGSKAKAIPTADPDLKLPARIEQVTPVPVSHGSFEAKVHVDLGDQAQAVMPGMACTVKLTPYAKPDALTAPASAVFAEELDEDEHFVYFSGTDGQHEKRSVKVGKSAGGKTEILDGLKEGDEILLEKPKSDHKSKGPAK